MINLCLVFCLLTAGDDTVTPLAVAVLAPDGVSDSLVRRICAEAEAIWAPAGITFQWHRLRSKDEESAWPVEVTIDDRLSATREDALGWLTFTGDLPDRTIHLSRAHAERLLAFIPEGTALTILTREALVGRTLGRALAHEFGHYLLRSKAHTSRGLMRAEWTADELVSFRPDGFELTPEQRAAAIRIASVNSTQNPTGLPNHGRSGQE